MLGRIDLGAVDTKIGELKLPDGSILDVHEADGFTYRTLDGLGLAVKSAAEGDEQALAEVREATLWDLVRRCCPAATPEQIHSLTPTMCGIVLRVAQGRIAELLKQVEQAEGNGSGASGAPSQATASAPSPPVSPAPAAPASAPSF